MTGDSALAYQILRDALDPRPGRRLAVASRSRRPPRPLRYRLSEAEICRPATACSAALLAALARSSPLAAGGGPLLRSRLLPGLMALFDAD
ncbi:MAG: hypothetical protein KatS3mg059_0377 [Thermomicrobiales bacterium]|nr:MAG: hypothetical protein KatS3mg059_0377 [Thermomicrobiales bacterium]